MKILSSIAIAVLLFLSGCNLLQEGDELPVINANVLPSTAGSVLISGQGSEDRQVELLALANDNWQFLNWSGDIESDENPLNIILTENTQIFANFVLTGNEYRVNLQVTDGKSVTGLIFGQTQEATDGFDTDIDLESPPPPPEGVLHGWLAGSDRPLLYDFRNPYSNSVEWMLTIDPGDIDLINLSWDTESEMFSGLLVLSDSDESFTVNMMVENSAVLNISGETTYQIQYIPEN